MKDKNPETLVPSGVFLYVLFCVASKIVSQLLFPSFTLFSQIFGPADPVNRVRCAVLRCGKTNWRNKPILPTFSANWMDFECATFHLPLMTPSWSGPRRIYIYIIRSLNKFNLHLISCVRQEALDSCVQINELFCQSPLNFNSAENFYCSCKSRSNLLQWTKHPSLAENETCILLLINQCHIPYTVANCVI